METWNRLTEVRGERMGDWMKGEEISQKTYVHSPWTQINSGEGQGKGGGRWVEVGKGGVPTGDMCNSVNSKKKLEQ